MSLIKITTGRGIEFIDLRHCHTLCLRDHTALQAEGGQTTRRLWYAAIGSAGDYSGVIDPQEERILLRWIEAQREKAFGKATPDPKPDPSDT